MPEHPLYSNRLVHQKSPYLLQHAHNPVDWYPWGDEAFQVAKDQDKPIFLSIGYATCHWCHVMERESFENIEVAQLMNENFVNIKVDREELPDVDSLYMEFAQTMMAGAAGWPLNVIITPELHPFFASTYLPPYSSHGLMGLTDLILRISEIWAGEDRDKILTQAARIVEVFSSNIHTKGDLLPEAEVVDTAAELLYKLSDPVYGGLNGAPKFPIGYQSGFMLRYYRKKKDSRALFLVERALEMMYRGGIYDHLGGGFSRYSVDAQWLIPHFEKMLYDNAIIAQSYLEAWQLTKKPIYRQVCEEICQYILRDMTHPEGGFYSAEDADSEGHEGFFYTWTRDEIEKNLRDKASLFCEFYGITSEGNFEGRNVLHIPIPLEEFAEARKMNAENLQRDLEEQRKELWKIREQRVHPLKDDKILSGWNGLMIHTLAEAGKTFNYEPYLQAALRAARFIKGHLWQEGTLLRRWRDGQAMFNGGLDEYACMIRGALSLFEANAGTEWLDWSIEMTELLKERYKSEEGAFYQTDGMDKNLLMRRCQFSDGAEPSGNAVHAENLLRLFQITSERDYMTQAEDIFKGVKDNLENYPLGYAFHVMNLQWYYDYKSPALTISLNAKRELEEELKENIYSEFIPHKTMIWQSADLELQEILPFIKEQYPLEDKTTLYICHRGVCLAPANSSATIKAAIDKL